jgi:hypothetical protein
MLILGLLHLLDKHLIDLIRLSLHILDDCLPLSKTLERFDQFHALLHSLDNLECEFDDILINVF